MPDTHPQLLAAVAPFLDADEEVWAIFASPRTSLVATGVRLFVVGRRGAVAWPLDEFAGLRRARPSLALLDRSSGGTVALSVDPRDEHGIQALTVIGLLVAIAAKPGLRPGEAPLAQSAPIVRRRPARRHIVVIPATASHRPARHWVVVRPGPQRPPDATSSERAPHGS